MDERSFVVIVAGLAYDLRVNYLAEYLLGAIRSISIYGIGRYRRQCLFYLDGSDGYMRLEGVAEWEPFDADKIRRAVEAWRAD